MGRRLPHSALIYALALLQLVAVPVASVLDGQTAATAAPAIPHVEAYAAEHASLAHAHDCAVCSFMRATFTPHAGRAAVAVPSVWHPRVATDARASELLHARVTLPRAPPERTT